MSSLNSSPSKQGNKLSFCVLLTVLIFSTLFFPLQAFATTLTYSTPGTFTWNCPAGVYSVTVYAWGAGGSGNASNGGANESGAGGGAFATAAVPVTCPGAYTVTVGNAI